MSKKVLIADDDRNHLSALKIRLEAAGYEVVCAQDSYQAIQLVQTTNPDVVILDINMPAGDGFSVQERFTKMDKFKGTPVIYLTGERTERVKAMASAQNAFSVFYKPCDSQELIASVNAALSEASSSEAA
tara:strand:- start:751 stop:1140 length:390 start_codon:yes stop_codon:yes gene_type:complete